MAAPTKKVTREELEVPKTQEEIVVKPSVTREQLEVPKTESEVEKMRREVLKDLVGDSNVREILFMKGRTPRSAYTAEFKNKEKKVITMLEPEEGQKIGTIEEFRVNGAVAQVPVGIPVLVPESVAKGFRGYKEGERTVGYNIPNSRGGMGIRADQDNGMKDALDL